MAADIAIIGGSIAAVTAADTLRIAGHDGGITVLSDEVHPPYLRPPLSKAVLAGSEAPESVFVAKLGGDVTLRTGCRAVGLDTGRRRVLLADGEEVPYSGLVIATGARARRLGPPETAELVVRDLDDALKLRRLFAEARSLIVVGGGLLGMEVASTARKTGLEVTVVDRDSPLVRHFGAFLAQHMTAAAVESGVLLRHCPGGIELLGSDPVTGVRTADGTVLEADLVVSAVGCRPNVEWLDGTGMAGVGTLGLAVDERCRLRPDIVAAGDVAARSAPRTGELRRFPHWASAIDQARVAATALIRGDAAAPYRPQPYFWTEQFGMEIKVCGEIIPEAHAQVLDGTMAQRDALLQWTVDGEPVAAATVNRRMPLVKLRNLAAPAQAPA